MLHFLLNLASLILLAASRETVNFDFAWRFRLNDEPGAACTFEHGVNYGTGSIWSGQVADEKECCTKCATYSGCVAWDFVIANSLDDQGDKNCYLKDNGDKKDTDPHRISGRVSPQPLPSDPPESRLDFDDSSWEVVDAPHDMLITGRYDRVNSQQQAFLPRGRGWYRKHFAAPAEWSGLAVWVYLEGIFHETTVWLNGKKLGFHAQGYTSFWYRLDDNGLKFGSGTDSSMENVLAIYVDASSGTGWWYEGGGLTRHHYLVATSPLFMPPHASWVHADMTSAKIVENGRTPSEGLAATDVAFVVESAVRNGGKQSSPNVRLTIDFLNKAGGYVCSDAELGSSPVTLEPGADHTFVITTHCSITVQLWSVARPALITANLKVMVGDKLVDAQEIIFGARSVRFDADTGFLLNEKRTKMRGFCDHSNFGGVGAAVPDRVNLFRVQTLRAVGGNAWRMAHNDPIPIRLDFMDRLGMLAMDENRDYGGHRGQGGVTKEDVTAEIQDMGDLVLRDRSHPSVVIWSFCNEGGCNNESAARDFRNVTYTFDGTRPVTQNHLGSGTHPLSMFSLDVQGMSHRSGDAMDTFHENNPKVPIVASECCSCMSQRGVDADFCPEPKDGGDDRCHDAQGHGGSDGVFYNNEIAECTANQVMWSDSREFNAGTFVWSGFDYIGESRGWPQTGKARGTVADLAGFAKESRWWLRSWWFSNISAQDHGKPILWPSASRLEGPTTLYIPESWVPVPGSQTRTIHVYTNAPFVRLWVNGKQVGNTTAVPFFGIATFAGTNFEAGNLTAEALSEHPNGRQLATFTVRTSKTASNVRLSLDAPSPDTGTGSALVADGEDVAMLRVELLDDEGTLVTQDASAFSNVTFSVVSGGGRLIATHSGSPAVQTRGPTIAAYHGLARAFVRSSEDHATSAVHRRLLNQIDIDTGKGASALIVDSSTNDLLDLDPIVVQAKVEGLPAASISIPLTRDLNQLSLAVAASSAQSAFSEFQSHAGLTWI